MPALVTEKHDKIYRDMVKQIRIDIGRTVKLFLPGGKRRCSNCLLNTVDNKSSGIYRPDSPYPTAEMPGPTPFTFGLCPVCRGSGYYSTRTIVKNVLCHVRWRIPDERRHVSLGDVMDADCRLQADAQFLNDFKRPPLKVEVDGFNLEVTKVYPRGLKGIAQIIVFLKLSDMNIPGNRNRVTHGGPL